jgi:hypothetical protein
MAAALAANSAERGLSCECKTVMGIPDQAFDDASISLYAKGSKPNKSQILPKY